MFIVAVIATANLLYLLWCDLSLRLLPNKWVLAYAILFVPAIFFIKPAFNQLAWHIGIGFIAFIVLVVFFSIGAMGGGDVKLGGAVFLWAGSNYWLQALIIIAWLGAVIGIIGWLLDRKCIANIEFKPVRYIRCALSAQRGVPYGVALASAGLFVLWQYYLSWHYITMEFL